MRRLFTLLCLIVLPGCLAEVSAQTPDLKQLLQNNRVSLTYSFNATGDIPVTGNGTATIQGKCFKVEGNGIRILCDSVSRWIIDPKAKEVCIEDAKSPGSGFSSDPLSYLSSLSNVRETKGVIEATYSSEGNPDIHFRIRDIRKSSFSANVDEFVFRTDNLEKEGWIVTDLR